jgi:hypothetical protein
MKKIFLFLVLCISSSILYAQNVGIGTTTPSSRLHLVGNLLQESGTVTLNNASSIIQFQNAGLNKTFMQLSGDNLRLGTNGGNQFGKTIIRMAGADRVLIDSTGNTQILGLQDASLTSDGYITLGSITGRNMILDNNEIIVRDNGGIDNLILQNDGGNVGIGVGSPTAKLHVNGDVRITDGNQASGRVLTSDANGNASWQNSAYSNNDRIMIRYTGFGIDSLIDGSTIVYDNGGINFNFINTQFTVTKAGLYHFEGTAQIEIPFESPTSTQHIGLRVFLSLNSQPPIPLNSVWIEALTLGSKHIVPFKIDIYLEAGSAVRFKMMRQVSIGFGNSNEPGYISAYLISE